MRHFRHKKSQGVYRVLFEEAFLEASQTRAVIYQDTLSPHITWVRDHAEFFDGRFEEVFDYTVFTNINKIEHIWSTSLVNAILEFQKKFPEIEVTSVKIS